MRQFVVLACLVLQLYSTQADTVSFSNQTGLKFSFQNMVESGANVPPSNLESLTLFTNPYDAIQFKPSAFVAVESKLGTLETNSLSSTINFTALSNAGLAMEKLLIDIEGTYYEFGLPGQTSVLQTTLSLDPIKFTIGGNTKTWSPSMNVTRNTTDKTWAGHLEVTKSDLQSLFNSPSLEVTQLGVESLATVSATAQWGNANSYLTFLTYTLQPVPEPSTGALLAMAAVFGLRKRRA